jgi:adenylate cyclase
MESVAQLQLAGVAQEDDAVIEGGTSEIRLIRRSFENMKKSIKSWGKYVPWPVVQLLLRANVGANLAVNEVEVTAYFSDIASFTTIVEGLPPERSLLLLSRYFNDMTKVIDDHGGVIIEFIGDAIFCIYGAPLKNPDHPASACKAALRMLSTLKRMNQWSVSKDMPEVKIRCGVHTGKVLIGNMGFHSRMKYGVVGEDSHIPGKLEEINKTYASQMMISHATWQRIDRDDFITRPVDFVKLREAPDAPGEPIYQVFDRERKTQKSNRLWAPANLHAEGMELYRKRDFETAESTFAQVGDMMEGITGAEDEASQLMINRCRQYLKQPPPANWDGVWDEGGG